MTDGVGFALDAIVDRGVEPNPARAGGDAGTGVGFGLQPSTTARTADTMIARHMNNTVASLVGICWWIRQARMLAGQLFGPIVAILLC